MRGIYTSIMLIVVVLILTASVSISTTEARPVNPSPCSQCHASNGVGLLAVTNAAGEPPARDTFTIALTETITIIIRGSGAGPPAAEPAISLEFPTALHRHVMVQGAKPAADGSFAFYVQDGDENDKDPSPMNVKGIINITIDSAAAPGDYKLTADYEQMTNKGSGGMPTPITLNVVVKRLKSSSITLSTSFPSVTTNSPVTISGAINPPLQASVTIEYEYEGTWNSLADVNSSRDGVYSYTWPPEKPGEYSIRASWKGDEEYDAAESSERSLVVSKPIGALFYTLGTGLLLGVALMTIVVFIFAGKGQRYYPSQVK